MNKHIKSPLSALEQVLLFNKINKKLDGKVTASELKMIIAENRTL
jgi:hypothetical protein